jgi:hypothetical protein
MAGNIYDFEEKLYGLSTEATTALKSVQDAMTAAAGGGQKASGASVLTAQMSRVTTVATAADSVTLPAATPRKVVVVVNAAAANSMNVFPALGDAIDAGAANAAKAVAAAKTVVFYCASAGLWSSILSA